MLTQANGVFSSTSLYVDRRTCINLLHLCLYLLLEMNNAFIPHLYVGK